MDADRLRLSGFLLLGLLILPEPIPGQASPARVVIAWNVACRTEPGESFPAASRYDFGDFIIPRARRDAGGAAWYADGSRTRAPCWIHGSLTVEWADREAALVAAADRMLARTETMSFEELVALDNFLVQTRPRAHAETRVIDESPILQLRRLQVLELAAEAPGTMTHEVERDPLKHAWFFAHRDVLSRHEPAGRWVVEAETLWRLFERHRDTEWAEEMAWAAAQGRVIRDECDGVCTLRVLLGTVVRYWTAFPEGRWVPQAVEQALAATARASGCDHSSLQELREIPAEFRAGLQALSAARREVLLRHVEAIERTCAAA